MVSLCSSVDFYTGPFAGQYDTYVEAKILPDPAALFSLCSRFLAVSRPQKLLDVGIGTGLSSLPFQRQTPSLKIYGLDGSSVMLDKCQMTIPSAILKSVDLDRSPLPFRNDMFDVSISQGTLYFLKEAADIVASMIHVTRPGGLIAFNIEASPDDKLRIRENDATWRRDQPKSILTYQHPLSDVMATVVTSGAEIIAQRERVAMEKMDGSAVRFTDILARKL